MEKIEIRELALTFEHRQGIHAHQVPPVKIVMPVFVFLRAIPLAESRVQDQSNFKMKMRLGQRERRVGRMTDNAQHISGFDRAAPAHSGRDGRQMGIKRIDHPGGTSMGQHHVFAVIRIPGHGIYISHVAIRHRMHGILRSAGAIPPAGGNIHTFMKVRRQTLAILGRAHRAEHPGFGPPRSRRLKHLEVITIEHPLRGKNKAPELVGWLAVLRRQNQVRRLRLFDLRSRLHGAEIQAANQAGADKSEKRQQGHKLITAAFISQDHEAEIIGRIEGDASSMIHKKITCRGARRVYKE